MRRIEHESENRLIRCKCGKEYLVTVTRSFQRYDYEARGTLCAESWNKLECDACYRAFRRRCAALLKISAGKGEA